MKKYCLIFFIFIFICLSLSQSCNDNSDCEVDPLPPCVASIECDLETLECVETLKECENGSPCSEDACVNDELQCQVRECIAYPDDPDKDSFCTISYDFPCPSTNSCLEYYCSYGEGCTNYENSCSDYKGCTIDICADPTGVGCAHEPIENCTECAGIGCVSNDPCIESKCYVRLEDGTEIPIEDLEDILGRSLKNSRSLLRGGGPIFEPFCKEFYGCTSSETPTTAVVTTGEETTEVSTTTSDVTSATTDITSATTSDITSQTGPSSISNTFHHSIGHSSHHSIGHSSHHSIGHSSHHSIGGHTNGQSSHHSIGGHTNGQSSHHSVGGHTNGQSSHHSVGGHTNGQSSHHSIGGHTINHSGHSSSHHSIGGTGHHPNKPDEVDCNCPKGHECLILKNGYTCIPIEDCDDDNHHHKKPKHHKNF